MKVPRFVGAVDEEPDQERTEIDPSRVCFYETPEYLQRAEHLRKKALFDGDHNRKAGKSTSSQVRSLKMRTEKPKAECDSFSDDEELVGKDLE